MKSQQRCSKAGQKWSCESELECGIIKSERKTEDKKMTKKYFKVEAKCGHVGRGNCIWITFATTAETAKEAAKKAREFKRVKHDHKNAIRNVVEITLEEFVQIKMANDIDPYLHCKNVQEQRKIEGFESRIEIDNRTEKRVSKKKDSTYKQKKQSIYDTEIKRYYMDAIRGVAI
jgi:hypothetical protein